MATVACDQRSKDRADSPIEVLDKCVRYTVAYKQGSDPSDTAQCLHNGIVINEHLACIAFGDQPVKNVALCILLGMVVLAAFALGVWDAKVDAITIFRSPVLDRR